MLRAAESGPNPLWSGSLLPQIDAIPNTRPQFPCATAIGDRYRPQSDEREAMSKRPRYEASSGNPMLRDPRNSPGKMVISAVRSPGYYPERTTPSELANFHQAETENLRALEGQDPSGILLCQRCRQSLRAVPDTEGLDRAPEAGDSWNRNPELAYVTQAAAAALSQLADTLRSGMSSGRRGVAQGSQRIGFADYPPIAQSGLKLTLNWLLGKINYVNELADNYVQRAPLNPGTTIDLDPENSSNLQDGSSDIMKRRYPSGIDEHGHADAADSAAPADANQPKRRSLAAGLSGPDELPPIRSQTSYFPPMSTPDALGPRASNLQHPPPQSRQLPSPPGRSLSSPTSLSFQASSSAYGQPQSVGLPPASTLQQTNVSNVLPPISVGSSSESALREHAAALQHEISVQKMALSSLQAEHDKLLAAFLRSQTRASALEKKHAALRAEIRRLQHRCAEIEGALRAVAEEGQSMEGAADALKTAGRSIIDRVSAVLQGDESSTTHT
ncbi:hypothetical protein DH86_00000668 [Scytalidium sp. 3C]|nr:hypothetical protein DH86_00000668 [Scytalidium sp. 3C]